jgi:hypothetical protein
VVVERVAAEFAQARVLSVGERQLKVQGTDDGEPITVSRSDAYRIGGYAPRAADYAICGASRDRWEPCHVVRAQGGEVTVRLSGSDGDVTLAVERVIVPSAVTALNVRRFLDAVHERRVFVDAVARAGVPPRPRGWLPEAREPVVARRGDRWYSANVDGPSEDGGVRVIWLGGDRSELVPEDAIVPIPPFAHQFVAGEFALSRAATVGEPWEPVRIEAVGPEEAVVLEQSGRRGRASLRSLIPLVGAGAPPP